MRIHNFESFLEHLNKTQNIRTFAGSLGIEAHDSINKKDVIVLFSNNGNRYEVLVNGGNYNILSINNTPVPDDKFNMSEARFKKFLNDISKEEEPSYILPNLKSKVK